MPTLVYEDFSSGDYGTLDPSKVPPGFFHASNLVLYRTGALGPRGGLKTFSLGRSPAGDINMFGFTDSSTRSLVWQEGLNIYATDPLGVAGPVLFGAVDISAAVPNPYVDIARANSTFATPGGTIYALFHFATTPMYTLPTSEAVGGTAMGVYELMVVSNQKPAEVDGIQTAGRRIVWTNFDNFTDWPGFQDVMHSGEVSGIFPVKNYLVLAMSDGRWYVITNTLGVNNRVRRVNGASLTPPFMPPSAFVAPGDDIVYALSPQGNYPITFDGVSPQELKYLSLIPDTPLASYVPTGTIAAQRDGAANAVKALAGDGPTGVVMVRPDTVNKALVKHNGAWTFHAFETAVSQFWASNRRGKLWTFNRKTPSAQTCMSLDLNLDRPAFTSDTNSQPGDMSTTPFDAFVELPEVWAQDSTELRVREVTVDIFRWNTGAPVDNRVQAALTTLARGALGNASSNNSNTTTVSWTQPGASSPTTQDGAPDRIKLNFGTQGPAAGFRLRLSGLRGVAIRRITVKFDGEPRETRGWS